MKTNPNTRNKQKLKAKKGNLRWRNYLKMKMKPETEEIAEMAV